MAAAMAGRPMASDDGGYYSGWRGFFRFRRDRLRERKLCADGHDFTPWNGWVGEAREMRQCRRCNWQEFTMVCELCEPKLRLTVGAWARHVRRQHLVEAAAAARAPIVVEGDDG